VGVLGLDCAWTRRSLARATPTLFYGCHENELWCVGPGEEHLELPEISASTLHRAHAVRSIVATWVEYSLGRDNRALEDHEGARSQDGFLPFGGASSPSALHISAQLSLNEVREVVVY
jgi:hypothetical protein